MDIVINLDFAQEVLNNMSSKEWPPDVTAPHS